MNQPRFYRKWTHSDLIDFQVQDEETDILISAEKRLETKAKDLINRYRNTIIDYIKVNPEFKTSLTPLPVDHDAPAIIKSMLKAASLTGVGPMAAIAGAISEFTGKALLQFSKEVILENGGDIFIKTEKERKIGIYAGNSPLSGKISIRIKPEFTPCGVCTSSGTVGHSLSFGRADAVSIISYDTALSDACATATANRVKDEKDMEEALNFAKSIEGIIGAVVIYGNKVGIKGKVELG